MNDKRTLSRAELVRLRRQQEHSKQLQRASKTTARHVVVTRARKDITKPVRQPARKNARRFQIALPHLTRAEMSFRLPRLRLGWRLFSFVLVVIFGSALYFAFNLPEFRVTEAQVTGSRFVTPAEINAALDVSGQPIFLLIPSDLETRLRLNYPELVAVHVTVSLPNLLSVSVTERQPLIRWEQGGGYTWISEDGVAFRPRGELAGLIPVVALSAPSVEGGAGDPLSPAPFISAEMVQALKGLVAHVPPGVPILYEQGVGFGWNDPRGWRVHFGTKAGDVKLKIRVYEALVASLAQKGIRPVMINVMYPSAPYYRLNE
jgi:hypothetical protein